MWQKEIISWEGLWQAVNVDRERNGIFLKGGNSVKRMTEGSGIEEAIHKNWASALLPTPDNLAGQDQNTPDLLYPYPEQLNSWPKLFISNSNFTGHPDGSHSQSFASKPHQPCFLKFFLNFLDAYLSLLSVGTTHVDFLVHGRCKYGGKEFHSTHLILQKLSLDKKNQSGTQFFQSLKYLQALFDLFVHHYFL